MNNCGYLAYELLAMLKYLTLTGQDEEGNLEWVGTDEQWRLAREEIYNYELKLADL